jgi:hypothetical protein
VGYLRMAVCHRRHVCDDFAVMPTKLDAGEAIKINQPVGVAVGDKLYSKTVAIAYIQAECDLEYSAEMGGDEQTIEVVVRFRISQAVVTEQLMRDIGDLSWSG